MNELRGHFRPEFLNRLDEIIMFKPLTKDNIGHIIHLLMKELNDIYGRKGISYPVIYGAVCGRLDTGLADAVRAYVFSTANSLVQSALKLIPLGNTEAQKILFDSAGLMEHVSELCMNTAIGEISNFCPALDIAGIRHETLGVRLYMS